MTSFEFTVHGPFDIPLEGAGQSARVPQRFWRTDALRDVASGIGCYVFVMKSPKGKLTPSYVGLTEVKFSDEVFNAPNLPKYIRSIQHSKTGTPQLFLITPPGQFNRNRSAFVAQLESLLIGAAFARNPYLQNKKGIKRPRWRVPGVSGKARGKATAPARKLRKAMGFTSDRRLR